MPTVIPSSALSSGQPDGSLVFRAILWMSKGLNHPFPDEAIPDIADLIVRLGWNPSDRAFEESRTSLLEFLAEHTRWLPPKEDVPLWPVDLQAFEALSTQPDAPVKTVDWLMGLAVASGANPWLNTSDALPLKLLVDCVRHSHWGVVAQMQQLLGAPDLQTLCDAKLGMFAVGQEKTFGAHLANAPESGKLLELLLGRSITQYVPSVEVWGAAHPEALEVLLKHAPFPTNTKDRAAIERAWTTRLSTKALSPTNYARLAGAVSQQSAAVERSAPSEEASVALGMIKQSLGVQWDSLKIRHRNSDEQQEVGLGSAFVTAQVQVSNSKLDGQWSVVSARFVQYIREMHWDSRGIASPPCNYWLFNEQSNTAGSMAAAVGQPWRQGISQDGMIALGLLAKALRVSLKSRFERINEAAACFDGLETEASLFGIEDWAQWTQGHRQDAVATTEVLLERATTKGATALACAWGQAFTRFPQWFAKEPLLGARLMRALQRNGETVALPLLSGQRKFFGALGEEFGFSLVVAALARPFGMTPWNANELKPVELASVSMDERRLLAEVALALESKEWLQAFAKAGVQGLLDADILAVHPGGGGVAGRAPRQ